MNKTTAENSLKALLENKGACLMEKCLMGGRGEDRRTKKEIRKEDHICLSP